VQALGLGRFIVFIMSYGLLCLTEGFLLVDKVKFLLVVHTPVKKRNRIGWELDVEQAVSLDIY
jgi:hypothetical protein